ncbi:hypothetical protein M407DRAFT_241890 [Tulasnella calospora MUT 4182]|uniref:Uncharacterized protein n=1 Tax=Tulasnella calospora MUT 4182 TaxID=1051891 RepID=A0A0C3QR84_9AGAM|nr:hypothetical protein M407DRAFT_241890 [Tulasnella calospora MUT 4182]
MVQVAWLDRRNSQRHDLSGCSIYQIQVANMPGQGSHQTLPAHYRTDSDAGLISQANIVTDGLR